MFFTRKAGGTLQSLVLCRDRIEKQRSPTSIQVYGPYRPAYSIDSPELNRDSPVEASLFRTVFAFVVLDPRFLAGPSRGIAREDRL